MLDPSVLARMPAYPGDFLRAFTRSAVREAASGVLWGSGRRGGDPDLERHRLALWRTWDSARGVCLFIGLNPSTADFEHDDPTVRRMRGFAERWGFGSLVVCNIFSLRSTDPRLLMVDPNVVTDTNDWVIRVAAGFADRIICAWGVHGRLYRRGPTVADILRALGCTAYCLGFTHEGDPRHPLYLANSTPATLYITAHDKPEEDQLWPVRPPLRPSRLPTHPA